MITRDELDSYDHFLVMFSGGKDSLACLLWLLEQGVDRSKVELWHHDVDGREGSTLMDWPVTPSYCQAIADGFDLPLYTSWKVGGIEGEMLRENALTKPTRWEQPDGSIGQSGGVRGKKNTRRKFPQVTANLQTRWCSAVAKIDVCGAAIRGQARFDGKRTLVITGERAQESAARANYETFEVDRTDGREVTFREFRPDGSVKRVKRGRKGRHVDHIRPIHGWTERQVWEKIRSWRVQPHPAYQLGFARCSCMFCIFGNADQFATAAQLNPAGMQRLDELEADFGVTMKRKVSLPQLRAKGTAYAYDPAVAAVAMGREFSADEIFQTVWKLPLGAFAEGCGPS